MKRAWRTSPIFTNAMAGKMGERTQRIGEVVRDHLLAGGMELEEAEVVARSLATIFGKVKEEKGENSMRIEQLAFISPEERVAVLELADRIRNGEKIDLENIKKTGKILRTSDTAVDIALFGRMLAGDREYNRDAAAQVAHAITTHRVTIEDDYFTAIDDLKHPSENAGAAYLDDAAFGSGVFYIYICIDRKLLLKNLGGDAALAAAAMAAFVEASATSAPRGKQNSFAAHGRPQFILAEKGDQQPRTLAGAFAKPITGNQIMEDSIMALQEFRTQMDKAYGADYSSSEAVMHVGMSGTLAEIIKFSQS
jgi:CRISPR system Cascade subunit CasC